MGSNERNAGDGQGARNHAERVVRVLRAHGFPDSSARILLPVANALVVQALQATAEYAASFDIDTAQPAGSLGSGTRSEVDVTDQVDAMRPDRRYISIHTHHQSTAFSDRDVELLLRNVPIRTIIAVGHDRTRTTL